MRLNKLISAALLMLVCITMASAQRGIHSDAYGKTVFWQKNNVHYQSLKKSMSPSGIYSDALGKTVFIGNNEKSTKNISKRSDAPSLVFANADLDWASIQQDESMPALQDIFTQITTEITGYELILEESLILDDKLIELYRTGNNFGSYIICSDLETGTKIWNQSYNLTNDDKIEIDLSLFVRSDGNLEISGMRLLSPIVPNLFPFGIATRKIVNINTGELIERHFSTFDEGGVICNNPNGQFGRTLPIMEDESYLTSCAYPSTNGDYIQVQFLMDGNGKLIDTIGFVPNILSGQGNESHKYIEAYQLPNNNIIVGSSSTANPTDPELTFSELVLLSPSGEFIDRIDVSEHLNYSTFFDLKVRGEHILLTTVTYDDFFDPESYKNHVLILDQNGEVALSLNGFRELDGESVRNIKITPLENNEFILVSSEGDHCLKYFRIDIDQNVDHLKTICLEEEMWVTLPTSISYIDGDVITSGSWEMEGLEDAGSFKGTFKLPLSELGVSTSVSTIENDIEDAFQLFPNPVSTELTIQLGEKSNGTIQLYNSMGSLVLQQQLYNQAFVRLSVASLMEGMYNVVWTDENQVRSNSFIKNTNE